MSALPSETRVSWYRQLKEAAETGDSKAIKRFNEFKRKQNEYRRKHVAKKRAEKKGVGNVAAVQHIPLAAIPERPKPTKKRNRFGEPMQRPGVPAGYSVRALRAAVLEPRPMRVVVKAGSEITVTIGGVQVQILAEER